MDSTPVRSAQRVVEAIDLAGVRYVFGIPGAKIDAVFDALLDSSAEVVVCRHEQNAAFMAAAIGRLTGIPGVVAGDLRAGHHQPGDRADHRHHGAGSHGGDLRRSIARPAAQAHSPIDGRCRSTQHGHQVRR